MNLASLYPSPEKREHFLHQLKPHGHLECYEKKDSASTNMSKEGNERHES